MVLSFHFIIFNINRKQIKKFNPNNIDFDELQKCYAKIQKLKEEFFKSKEFKAVKAQNTSKKLKGRI